MPWSAGANHHVFGFRLWTRENLRELISSFIQNCVEVQHASREGTIKGCSDISLIERGTSPPGQVCFQGFAPFDLVVTDKVVEARVAASPSVTVNFCIEILDELL